MHDNPFQSARMQMHEAYLLLGKQYEREFEALQTPDRVIEVSIPVVMDDGSTRVFIGYRSEHNAARGPYKWGIRYHQDVTKEEVMALSVWMSMKCAVLDLPLGGGKWGVIVDPKMLSKREIESLSREWVRKLYKYLWPLHDIPAPDVNTNSEIMAWMVDEYSRLVGTWSPWAFTGKPLSIGGSLGRDTATAQWGFFVLEKYLTLSGHGLEGKRVIVQWAGNAWLTMIDLLSKAWATIVGTSDSHTAIFDEAGLDVKEIITLKHAKKSLEEYHGATKLSNDELLIKACDILIPAALENQITGENAEKVDTEIILELANGPTTPEADAILFGRWIPVIPDILANAWGVTVSYFEQVQNNANYYWSREEVHEKLERKMQTALSEVLLQAKEKHTSLRMGAYLVALERVLEAMRMRGI